VEKIFLPEKRLKFGLTGRRKAEGSVSGNFRDNRGRQKVTLTHMLSFQPNPKKSIALRIWQLGVPQTTIHNVFHKKLILQA
jgi:hypothetical protein